MWPKCHRPGVGGGLNTALRALEAGNTGHVPVGRGPGPPVILRRARALFTRVKGGVGHPHDQSPPDNITLGIRFHSTYGFGRTQIFRPRQPQRRRPEDGYEIGKPVSGRVEGRLGLADEITVAGPPASLVGVTETRHPWPVATCESVFAARSQGQWGPPRVTLPVSTCPSGRAVLFPLTAAFPQCCPSVRSKGSGGQRNRGADLELSGEERLTHFQLEGRARAGDL